MIIDLELIDFSVKCSLSVTCSLLTPDDVFLFNHLYLLSVLILQILCEHKHSPQVHFSLYQLTSCSRSNTEPATVRSLALTPPPQLLSASPSLTPPPHFFHLHLLSAAVFQYINCCFNYVKYAAGLSLTDRLIDQISESSQPCLLCLCLFVDT